MANSLLTACVPATFGSPSVFGAEIVSLQASLVTNYGASVPSAFRFTQPSTTLRNATFCNVTVSYTHPGQNDNLHVEAWLPVHKWNDRFQAVGGIGWAAGRFSLSWTAMEGAIADGYATITTDAGLGGVQEATPWALVSPGNVNLYNLQNLGSVSLGDEATLGKSLIKSFYGRGPEFSYWNGCSQGGRQGLMLAQRYPTAYDGIVAAAPVIHWTDLFSSIQWPQQVMNMLGEYPYGCEIDAITAAAVSACDGLDGVVDGMIAEVDDCLASFDPFQVVDKTVNCSQTNGKVKVSTAAAAVVNAAWHGWQAVDGKRGWYGLSPGADLTGGSPASYGQPGIAATNCTAGSCVGAPNALGVQWLQLFVAKDPNFAFSNLTHAQFDQLVRVSQREFGSFINTDDPDLSEFRNAGGKMVTFHGLSDSLVPPKGSEQYYNEVMDLLPDAHDFYRYYKIPGLGHCFGGTSGQPEGLFEQLRAWVENDTAPEHTRVDLTDLGGNVQHRIVCPYPGKARFDNSCGDAAAEICWSCFDADGDGVCPQH